MEKKACSIAMLQIKRKENAMLDAYSTTLGWSPAFTQWHMAHVILRKWPCYVWQNVFVSVKLNYSMVGCWQVPFASLFVIPEATFFSSSFTAFGFVRSSLMGPLKE